MAMRGYEHDHESKWLSRMIAPLSRGEGRQSWAITLLR